MFTSPWTGFGIELSEHHIRMAQVSWLHRIVRLSEIDLPEGVIVDEDVVNAKAIQERVVQVLDSHGLLLRRHRLALLLPESRVFSSVFSIKPGLEKIQFQEQQYTSAQKQIPLPLDRGYLCFSRGSRENGMDIYSAHVVDKQIAKRLIEIVPRDLFNLVSLEANTKALFRLYRAFAKPSFRAQDPKKIVVIIDVGKTWTTIGVYNHNGQEMISRSVSYTSIHEICDKLCDTLEFVFEDSLSKTDHVEHILLAGMEGDDQALFDRITAKIKQPTLVHRMNEVLRLSDQTPAKLQAFGSSIGAALRAVHPFWYRKQYNFMSCLSDLP